MELIQPPKARGNWVVWAGGAAEGAVQSEVVSELGIPGWALFGGDGKKETLKGPQIYEREHEKGWLLRAKGTDSNEGAVAAEFSVLFAICRCPQMEGNFDGL